MAGEPNAGFDPSDWECHQELVGYDYSARRGPCPEGFHVPTTSERNNVITIGVSLGAWATTGTAATDVANFRTYLKLPNIVWLAPGSGQPSATSVPKRRYYWCCQQTGSDGSGRYAHALCVIEDSYSIATSRASSNHGCPVRPFKDIPVVPDNSWTMLYQSSEATGGDTSGIYYNATLGLISISSDGTTWITIADKNAGATTVWNYGDTVTDANGGGCFQRGNNYGFPISGATTTSSTRIDTTGYGPGNYYSGDTFITGGVNDDWFSPRNLNLWGGQATVTPVYEEVCPEFRYHGALQTYHFQPTLLNISELKQFPAEEGMFFTTPNVYGIAEELNKYPQVYYAKFLEENNLYSVYGKTNVLGNGEGSAYTVTETFKGEPYIYMAFYDTEAMKRDVYSKYGGLSIDV